MAPLERAVQGGAATPPYDNGGWLVPPLDDGLPDDSTRYVVRAQVGDEGRVPRVRAVPDVPARSAVPVPQHGWSRMQLERNSETDEVSVTGSCRCTVTFGRVGVGDAAPVLDAARWLVDSHIADPGVSLEELERRWVIERARRAGEDPPIFRAAAAAAGPRPEPDAALVAQVEMYRERGRSLMGIVEGLAQRCGVTGWLDERGEEHPLDEPVPSGQFALAWQARVDLATGEIHFDGGSASSTRASELRDGIAVGGSAASASGEQDRSWLGPNAAALVRPVTLSDMPAGAVLRRLVAGADPTCSEQGPDHSSSCCQGPLTPPAHGLLRTPVSLNAKGEIAAWCLCGEEFVAANLGAAHEAVFAHAEEALRVRLTPQQVAEKHGYASPDEMLHCETAGREVDTELDAEARAGGFSEASAAGLAELRAAMSAAEQSGDR